MADESLQLDKERQTIQDNIDKFGCHLGLIEADNYMPAFVYSIGLHQKFGRPEIICFGLKVDVMASMLNHACDLISKGEVLSANQLYSGFLEGYNIQFVAVQEDYYPNYVGFAGWFYDMTFDFPLMQIIWPDKEHHFPWDQEFNPNWKFKQPMLDRNVDFKFYEKRNLGVFTTKDAFEGHPILYVYHNDDGDWQFHTKADPNLDNGILVCLEEITKLDPTINEVFSLQYGGRAWRATQDDDWQIDETASNEDQTADRITE